MAMKVRGFRVEAGEIEAALAECPNVVQAVVAAEEDEAGDRSLVAYIAGAASAADLREALRQRLPEYMVPSRFVTVEQMPLTPNGKVDRLALRAGRSATTASESELVPPRDEMEKAIGEIWQRVLGIDRVSVHDGFFDSGGHSLKATRLVFEIQKTLGVTLGLIDVFRHQTIAELAERARRGTAAAAPPPIAPMTPDELELLRE